MSHSCSGTGSEQQNLGHNRRRGAKQGQPEQRVPVFVPLPFAEITAPMVPQPLAAAHSSEPCWTRDPSPGMSRQRHEFLLPLLLGKQASLLMASAVRDTNPIPFYGSFCFLCKTYLLLLLG